MAQNSEDVYTCKHLADFMLISEITLLGFTYGTMRVEHKPTVGNDHMLKRQRHNYVGYLKPHPRISLDKDSPTFKYHFARYRAI